ncbi:PhzF family phenazine biosynthesis protein [Rhodoferax sp. BAB1]|uniref:PhzF family phenazine biosynthesis protein n=1 Tax=Rhodoferax sp. BAB1 TaxID=2741720 RepID=UPI0015757114|nr:PhzF family phenazine biosynthesis protein [Rhodoferax sp. BAB1]QKO23685.1 PhzF family phenazine biosynthesis protein [Rhodoferax sp. BAB1]
MTQHQRPYKQVDVFTATPYRGNPLAVVLDGSGLSEDEMQRFAHWTNLSETTFLLPPTQAGADYRVRIFTPGGELPFAGHPTLGSCHAWLQAGGVPKHPDLIVQECAVGLVSIRRAGQHLAFAAPPLTRSTPEPALLAQIAQALGITAQQILAAQVLDNGPRWLGLLLDSVDTVLALEPDHQRLRELGQKVGVAALAQDSGAVQLIARSSRETRAFAEHADDAPQLAEPDLEVRAFAAPVGISEDPVTGSLNASLAQWLMAEGRLPASYVAAQGSCLGRAGRVLLERDAQGQVWVGGQVQTCITGSVLL